MTQAGGPTIADRIRTGLGTFSPAERKVARTLLAAYPAAGFDTVAGLAGRAGVSAPTVLRFAARLGYEGYPELQHALRDELEEREVSPLAAYAAERQDATAGRAADDPLERARAAFTAGLSETLSALPEYELREAVALLADPHRRVLAEGGRFSRLFAHYLVMHLAQIRGGSRLLPRGPVERADALAEVGPRDVLVLFDFRRYEESTRALAERVAERGAKVVLFTDQFLSPIAPTASVVLAARVDAPSAYDSFVPTLAIVETVVAGLLAELGEQAERRMALMEQTSDRHTLL